MSFLCWIHTLHSRSKPIYITQGDSLSKQTANNCWCDKWDVLCCIWRQNSFSFVLYIKIFRIDKTNNDTSSKYIMTRISKARNSLKISGKKCKTTLDLKIQLKTFLVWAVMMYSCCESCLWGHLNGSVLQELKSEQ